MTCVSASAAGQHIGMSNELEQLIFSYQNKDRLSTIKFCPKPNNLKANSHILGFLFVFHQQSEQKAKEGKREDEKFMEIFKKGKEKKYAEL